MNIIRSLLILVVLWGSVVAAAEKEPRLITVAGTGELLVEPDQVTVTLGVEHFSAQLETAKNGTAQSVAAILRTAKKFSVKPEHIQTSELTIDPEYDFDQRSGRRSRKLSGYLVRRSLTVTLTELSRFEEFLTAIIADGANRVQGIQFKRSDMTALREKARLMAVRVARDKAHSMAKELGQTVGEPYYIQENGEPQPFPVLNRMANASRVAEGASAGDETLAPGRLRVTSTVSVSFELK